jgi:hypothetical protein
MHWVCHICCDRFLDGGEIMEYTPMQYEILKTVFRQMDQELGIKPLTDEQMTAFKIKLEELDETDE